MCQLSVVRWVIFQEQRIMEDSGLNRRDSHRLSIAALGGAVAGTMAGCSEEKKPAAAPGTGAPGAARTEPAKPAGDEVAVAGEPHACSGLNACKGQGASGKNDCAGQGDCAAKSWYHSCAGQNDCKGQGGCGSEATQNDCKGKGSCHIPLMKSAWESARQHFEKKMEEAGKKVGAGSPPKS
jgi:hypothetical protein